MGHDGVPVQVERPSSLPRGVEPGREDDRERHGALAVRSLHELVYMIFTLKFSWWI